MASKPENHRVALEDGFGYIQTTQIGLFSTII